MCAIAEVSRSGYYQYVRELVIPSRKEKQDQADFELIKQAYRYRNRKKGARQIKMTLERKFETIMNLKKIRRLMKKYGLFCQIRKANPYKRMMKALQTDSIFENKLDRNFYPEIPGKVFSTDITYLYYPGGKGYLSSIMDLATKEVVSHRLSSSLEVPFVLDSVHILADKYTEESLEGSYIHSDQGCHYTSRQFQELVKEYHIGQSMSRRGNCWDNAPKESFFGHMKDELNLHLCKNFKELEEEINDYMDYYNNDRYQWRLSKMTPKEYREYLLYGLIPNTVNQINKKDDRLYRRSSSIEKL